MSGLELVGAASLYVAAVVAAAYVSAGIAAFFNRNAGLGGLVPVIISFFTVILIGAVSGLVLLGRAL
ncbi:hypothetical protein [Rhizobium sp.]|uniref:hypothetical protein n=1 Tax=Rhizobium sp. TaxID=391 RepID=UPI00289B204E